MVRARRREKKKKTRRSGIINAATVENSSNWLPGSQLYRVLYTCKCFYTCINISFIKLEPSAKKYICNILFILFKLRWRTTGCWQRISLPEVCHETRSFLLPIWKTDSGTDKQEERKLNRLVSLWPAEWNIRKKNRHELLISFQFLSLLIWDTGSTSPLSNARLRTSIVIGMVPKTWEIFLSKNQIILIFPFFRKRIRESGI